MGTFVNTTYAPELLIYTLTTWPTLDEQYEQRARLTAAGDLMSHTSALVDFRDVMTLPDAGDTSRTTALAAGIKRIAYVVATNDQARFVRTLQASGASPQFEPFFDEREALRWLFPTVGNAFPLTLLK